MKAAVAAALSMTANKGCNMEADEIHKIREGGG